MQMTRTMVQLHERATLLDHRLAFVDAVQGLRLLSVEDVESAKFTTLDNNCHEIKRMLDNAYQLGVAAGIRSGVRNVKDSIERLDEEGDLPYDEVW